MIAGKLYQLEGYIKETGLLDYGEKTVTFHTEKKQVRVAATYPAIQTDMYSATD